MRKRNLMFLILLILVFSGLSCKKGHKIQPVFSGERAYELLIHQCKLGPRFPGSPAHDSTLFWLENILKTYADTVYLQHFSYPDYNGNFMRMANVIARFSPDNCRRILLCAHWDTRPRAERDTIKENREKPILGANDGASGVAVLLALAEILRQSKPQIGVDIVLFDGEDYGVEGDISRYLMGSKYFAQNLPKPTPSVAILVDMVGDKELRIHKEGYSVLRCGPAVVETLWHRAKKLKLTAFVDSQGTAIIDDHLPLCEVGIRAVNIIDFDYPHWHTLEDTPDKCSPTSLEQVGKLLLDIVQNPPKDW